MIITKHYQSHIILFPLSYKTGWENILFLLCLCILDRAGYLAHCSWNITNVEWLKNIYENCLNMKRGLGYLSSRHWLHFFPKAKLSLLEIVLNSFLGSKIKLVDLKKKLALPPFHHSFPNKMSGIASPGLMQGWARAWSRTKTLEIFSL